MQANQQNVSRETKALLVDFCADLLRWNAKINLVAKSTEHQLYDRHIADSLQIFPLLGLAQTVVDLGSGGGLPALPLAIAGKARAPQTKFILIERDQRKCAFLRNAIQKFSLNATVISKNIMDIPNLQADVITARALANLSNLMFFCSQHLAQNGRAILMKGANHQSEIEEAKKHWTFEVKTHPSKTSGVSAILEVSNIRSLNAKV